MSDLWITEFEQALEMFADGRHTEEQTRARLRGLGLDRDEIDEQIAAIAADAIDTATEVYGHV